MQQPRQKGQKDNNYLQNNAQKTKDGASDEIAVPSSHVFHP